MIFEVPDGYRPDHPVELQVHLIVVVPNNLADPIRKLLMNLIHHWTCVKNYFTTFKVVTKLNTLYISCFLAGKQVTIQTQYFLDKK